MCNWTSQSYLLGFLVSLVTGLPWLPGHQGTLQVHGQRVLGCEGDPGGPESILLKLHLTRGTTIFVPVAKVGWWQVCFPFGSESGNSGQEVLRTLGIF